MENSTEEWRDIPEYGGYQASNLGRVRSVDREVACIGDQPLRKYKGKVLSQWCDRDGYPRVILGSKIGVKSVHSCVFRAFFGAVPQGKEINHRDGNKRNNAPSNLEACSCKENIAHAIAMGLRGSRMKISLADIPAIKFFHIGGRENERLLGLIFGVCRETIRKISVNDYCPSGIR